MPGAPGYSFTNATEAQESRNIGFNTALSRLNTEVLRYFLATEAFDASEPSP
ncbi:hypothetical protein NGC23_10390 [Leclercia pneumoniae]|uniref:hypothetical protein n=1 Tax=Leclercia pneumoniae TaxID=2815358 RepID=UPI002DBCD548|nr:hypothetical protein [Leclercia pneumoniae]MEB7500594.1 hypothetical protein [Leclercia pneumoniae]